ncbi:hypothetical protein FRB96_003095 [Tulasnella sp. 330]|nr:hypothetical protein FRB96_003095 [Tulasnella sp. 330]KAG8878310.1 hypothetical protein FRB97_002606 [Tulasnella sp. 331]
MSRAAVTAFHAAALALMVWAFDALDKLMNQTLLAKRMFWRSCNQEIVVCLLSDFFPTVKSYAKARRALVMVSMPLCLVVSLIYWTLLFFLPRLIIQSGIAGSEPSSDPFTEGNVFGPLFLIPLQVDLALHLSPFIVLATHFYLTEGKYSAHTSEVWAPITAVIFATWYAGYQEWCAAYNGTFSYPFLNVPLPARIVIYTVVTVLATKGFRLLNDSHKGVPAMPHVYSTPGGKQVAAWWSHAFVFYNRTCIHTQTQGTNRSF